MCYQLAKVSIVSSRSLGNLTMNPLLSSLSNKIFEQTLSQHSNFLVTLVLLLNRLSLDRSMLVDGLQLE